MGRRSEAGSKCTVKYRRDATVWIVFVYVPNISVAKYQAKNASGNKPLFMGIRKVLRELNNCLTCYVLYA